MSNYLVVAHQTADSVELADALLARKEKNPESEFVLMVPATRIEELRRPLENDRRANAERVALRALYAFNEDGLRFSRVTVGDESPLVAIQEEVASRPGFYEEIIISTLPVDFSKWISMGILEKVATTFNLPVTHVYGGVTSVE